MSESANVGGHVFLSYVREDAAHVDRLQQVLEDAGIRVWRDTKDLWPGLDWRDQIRHAITSGALVFVLCLSQASVSRVTSYQNEELTLAIDQLRLRRADHQWLIPVRFDDCQIPYREIDGRRTLSSIQRADLFGTTYHQQAERLAQAIQRLLRQGFEPEASAAPDDGDLPAAILRRGAQNLLRWRSRRMPDALTGNAVFVFPLVLAAVGVLIWFATIASGIYADTPHPPGSRAHRPSSSGTPHPSSSGTPADGLSAGARQFVSDMRSTFQFDRRVQNPDIASFGERVCGDRKTGASIAREAPIVQHKWTNTAPGEAIHMIVLAEKDICPAEQAAQTVTYVVTGSNAGNADVTYGPAGSGYQRAVPMSVTRPLRNPPSVYYYVLAQLQGNGSVTCHVEVDGVTIASASAAGGYTSARCQIGQDGTGSWENELAQN